MNKSIIFSENKSPFRLAVAKEDAAFVTELFKYRAGITPTLDEGDAPLLAMGGSSDPDATALQKALVEGEYALRLVKNGDEAKLIAAFTTNFTKYYALRYLIDKYCDGEGTFTVPEELDVRASADERDFMITSPIPDLRDPFLLYENGVYYLYGTDWVMYKNTSGKLDGAWDGPTPVVEMPGDYMKNQWAPEVHKYNGAYYLITTYCSNVTGHRGCAVFKSESPEGPFKMISDGHVTPSDWDSIDGTLYIGGDGCPWMVFVHEWTSTPDEIGTFAAARLSDDLTHFVSEPFDLFRADDPEWAHGEITDGCFMYRTDNGTLGMIWSNFDKYGYCVAGAVSDNGRLDGNWTQKARIYTETIASFDGGHGMLFTDTDGITYLSMHSPNDSKNGRDCVPVFLPVKEKNGEIVWDLGIE